MKEIGLGLMEPIVTGIINIIMKIIAALWNISVAYISTQFKPDLLSFDTYFKDGALEKMCQIFTVCGCILATCIFLFQLIIMFKTKPRELRNTPWSLLFRFIASMIMITVIGAKLPEVGVNITRDVWDIMNGYSKEIDIDIDNATKNVNDTISTLSSGNIEESKTWTEKLASAAKNVLDNYKDDIYYTLVFPLIYIFLMISILLNIIKLVLEIIERYVIMNIMARAFPVVAATYTSATTSNILTSYFKMFVSQLFLVLMSLFFTNGFLYICAKENSDTFSTFMGLCFVLAYLSCSQKLDSYISSLGVNVARSGDIIGTALNDFRGLAQLGRSLGSVKDNAGSFIKAGASLAGSKGLYDIGSTLAGDSTIKATGDFAERSGNNVKPNDAMGIISSGNKGAIDKFNAATSPEYKKDLLDYIAGGDINKALGGGTVIPESLEISNGKITGQMSLNDGKVVDFSASNKASNNDLATFETPEGKMHISSLSGNTLKPGEISTDVDRTNGLSAAELEAGINIDNLEMSDGQKSQIQAISGAVDGGIDINDLNNDTLCHISPRGDAEYAFNEGFKESDFIEGSVGANVDVMKAEATEQMTLEPYNQTTKEQIVTFRESGNAKDSNNITRQYTIKSAIEHQGNKGQKYTIDGKSVYIEKRDNKRRN